MQSWGTRSRFDRRDGGSEPSKSGVLGLVGAALGIDRADAAGLAPLVSLRLGVRVDRPGSPGVEFQTAQLRPRRHEEAALVWLEYLADASFLVGLEGDDRALLQGIQEALASPRWLLCLGRRAYAPSRPIFLTDGLRDDSLESALRNEPWPDSDCRTELKLILESEGVHGSPRRDVPVGAFADRKFATRYVVTTCVSLGSPV